EADTIGLTNCETSSSKKGPSPSQKPDNLTNGDRQSALQAQKPIAEVPESLPAGLVFVVAAVTEEADTIGLTNCETSSSKKGLSPSQKPDNLANGDRQSALQAQKPIAEVPESLPAGLVFVVAAVTKVSS
ncbi:hypothetical protein Dimus_029144, partial [Dionaea muscipula]